MKKILLILSAFIMLTALTNEPDSELSNYLGTEQINDSTEVISIENEN